MNWDWIASKQVQFNSVCSVIVIVTTLVVKKLLLRAVLRLDSQQPEVRRRWVVNIRNASLVAMLVGLMMIWAEPLHTLAVSFIALTVALVIATKELIVCVSGAAVRAVSKSYAVGDRIEIAGKRGDVVDQNRTWTVQPSVYRSRNCRSEQPAPQHAAHQRNLHARLRVARILHSSHLCRRLAALRTDPARGGPNRMQPFLGSSADVYEKHRESAWSR